jgi:hypothetical protein
MRTALARRSTWLRRTRAITGWVAAFATVATLLIAAVAGSASPPKRVVTALYAPRRLQSTVVIGAVHRVRVHRVHRRRAVLGNRVQRVQTYEAKAKAKAKAPAPTPAPPVAPIVVSGGS